MTGASFFSVAHQKRGKTQLELLTEEELVATHFPGFTAESFAFFQELSQHNDKGCFDQNRIRYEKHVTDVFRALLQTLTPFLLTLNSQFEISGKTNGNFSRINRDIRFSKDKTPYKPNYYLYVYDARHHRDHAGRLYVGLSADCVTAGFSIYDSWRGPKGTLQTVFRKRLETERELFDRLLKQTVRSKRYQTYWHRQEAGDWVQHPGLPRRDADWQTLQAWIVRKVYLPNSRAVAAPTFAEDVERIFKDLYPLYAFSSELGGKWRDSLRVRGKGQRQSPKGDAVGS